MWMNYWEVIKRVYCSVSSDLRKFFLFPCFIGLWGLTTIKDILKGRPFHMWRIYKKQRGMSPYHDCVNWVGTRIQPVCIKLQ